MTTNVYKRANNWLQIQLLSEAAYLVPLRLFIGIGWIRAGLEKFMDAGWLRGATLADFFSQHLTSGQVAFPFYRNLVQNAFTPNAVTMSWVIMVGQALVGIAILTGTFTNFALLCGLFMNLNFILIGEITPSAFYVVIQMVLLVTNTGYILSVDRFLSRKFPIGLLVAQPYSRRKYWRLEWRIYVGAAVTLALIALAVIPYIQDFTPNSVEDTPMILLVLSVIGGLTAWITAYKFPQTGKVAFRTVIPYRKIHFPEEREARQDRIGDRFA